MNRIYKNSDIKFNVDSDVRIANKFLIKFYTTNKSFNIQKTSDDIVIENETRYIKLNWSELSTIGDGVLNFVVNNMADDAEFDDKIYNDTFSRTTYYYISSNLDVSEDDTESFSQMLADLQSQANDIAKALQEERERATEADKELSQAIAKEKADRESTDSTLTANISAETTRAKAAEKKNADDISALTQTVNTNKTNLEKSISDEATARQNADTTLQTNIDNLTSTVSSNKSATDTAIANEKKAREEADTTLTNALDVEVKRAKAAEQANTTAIGNEETRAKGVEKGLADDIATLQSTKQDNLSGTPQQIKIENNVVSFADDAIWICGDY